MLSLTITIDATGVSTLNDAGYQIVLLADTRPAPLLVACLLAPISTQDVCWTDSEIVYVSMNPFQHGEVISINSHLSASAGQRYQFESNQLTEQGAGSGAQSIQIVNLNGTTVTGGQGSTFTTAQLNSPAAVAVTGASLLNNAQATFPAQNDYLISAISGVTVGSVVNASDFAATRESASPVAALSLTALPYATNQVDALTVAFNSNSNQFEAPT